MKNIRQKGMGGEYEVRDMLQAVVDEVYREFNEKERLRLPDEKPPKLLDIPVLKRNLEQTREGGSDIIGLDWAAIEVKRQETEKVEQWWRQTKAAAVLLDEEGNVVPGEYRKEPILIWRKNHMPWEARMLGYLAVAGDTKNGRVRSSVDINLPAFLAYFKLRVQMGLPNDEFMSAEDEARKHERGSLRPIPAPTQQELDAIEAQKALEIRAKLIENEAKVNETGAKDHESLEICGDCCRGVHWGCSFWIRSLSSPRACCCMASVI